MEVLMVIVSLIVGFVLGWLVTMNYMEKGISMMFKRLKDEEGIDIEEILSKNS